MGWTNIKYMVLTKIYQVVYLNMYVYVLKDSSKMI